MVPAVNEGEILKALPPNLRGDIMSMMMQDITAGVPIFQELNNGELAGLLVILQPLQVPMGEYVVVAGEQGHEMYLIMAGELAVYSTAGVDLATLSSGEYFGELAGEA
jgi:CRP-like cAMP-binding protein